MVSQTLLDHEVAFALAGDAHPLFTAKDILLWTHSRHVAVPEADFLIITGPGGQNAISKLRRGSPEMPDTGATVLFLLAQALGETEKQRNVTITGPGIPPPGEKKMPAMPLYKGDMEAIQEANREFPMGIDCFFFDPLGAVVGLPRSAVIKRES
jgi:alpha-D-ribose 1-methylphosphonate 5-triphosphate synthase subunit PhnH